MSHSQSHKPLFLSRVVRASLSQRKGATARSTPGPAHRWPGPRLAPTAAPLVLLLDCPCIMLMTDPPKLSHAPLHLRREQIPTYSDQIRLHKPPAGLSVAKGLGILARMARARAACRPLVLPRHAHRPEIILIVIATGPTLKRYAPPERSTAQGQRVSGHWALDAAGSWALCDL